MTPKVAELEARTKELDEAVADDSGASLNEVRDKFNRMCAAYVEAMFAVAEITEAGNVLVEDQRSFYNTLEEWKDQQYDFQNELKKLNELPELRGTLDTFQRRVYKKAPARLLREISERRPQRADRMPSTDHITPSTPDSEVRRPEPDGRQGLGR